MAWLLGMLVQPAAAEGVAAGSPRTLPTRTSAASTARTWKVYFAPLVRLPTTWEVDDAPPGMSVQETLDQPVEVVPRYCQFVMVDVLAPPHDNATAPSSGKAVRPPLGSACRYSQRVIDG